MWIKGTVQGWCWKIDRVASETWFVYTLRLALWSKDELILTKFTSNNPECQKIDWQQKLYNSHSGWNANVGVTKVFSPHREPYQTGGLFEEQARSNSGMKLISTDNYFWRINWSISGIGIYLRKDLKNPMALTLFPEQCQDEYCQGYCHSLPILLSDSLLSHGPILSLDIFMYFVSFALIWVPFFL